MDESARQEHPNLHFGNGSKRYFNLYCKRCRLLLTVPDLSETDRTQVVSSVRAGQHHRTIQLLRELAGLDLAQAKAVELHITRTRGICVRCQQQLQRLGETECERCGSCALDW